MPDRGFDRARQAASGSAAPSEPMAHTLDNVSAPVVETSGTAAAEATGKLQPDNEAPPQATAGSG